MAPNYIVPSNAPAIDWSSFVYDAPALDQTHTYAASSSMSPSSTSSFGSYPPSRDISLSPFSPATLSNATLPSDQYTAFFDFNDAFLDELAKDPECFMFDPVYNGDGYAIKQEDSSEMQKYLHYPALQLNSSPLIVSPR
ncbi:hypothetical protein DL93DRAFT_2069899, partial [Clavulina sp. PMI_390]